MATLRILQNEHLIENAAVTGQYLGDQLRAVLGKHKNVGDIRGRGMFYGIEFVSNRLTADPFPAKERLAWRLFQRAFKKGLIVYYSQGCADGVNGDLIMLGPPLIVTPEEIDVIVGRLADAVKEELG